MVKVLWSAGGLLMTLGFVALVFGWHTLLWLPATLLEIAISEPETYGLIVGGGVLMLLARLLMRRGYPRCALLKPDGWKRLQQLR